jgi:hypothetical protein
VTEKRSGPSERQRALWALTGFFVLAVGGVGTLVDDVDGSVAGFIVTRVSATGKTMWVRFVGDLSRDFRRGLTLGQKAEYGYRYDAGWRAHCSFGAAPYGFLFFGQP